MTVLLFAGIDYYPSGGWGDFIGEFDDVDSAKAESDSWIQVVEIPAEPDEWIRPWSFLMVSTNTSVTEPTPTHIGMAWGNGKVIDGPDPLGRWLVTHPAYTEERHENEWAHIVKDGEIVATWTRGHYGVPKGWQDSE